MTSPRIICFATQGRGSSDEKRIETLLAPLQPVVFPFDRAHKARSAWNLLRTVRSAESQMLVMEGTGIAGGLAVLLSRLLLGTPYVVSSGDAVAPFIAGLRPYLRLLAVAYERILCACAEGYIGWSPYLVGRALTLGAPRAMTAANWSAPMPATRERHALRSELGIPPQALVFGIVGSLTWNERVEYCYGLELVRALIEVDRRDVHVLVVGDGGGLAQLERLGARELGGRLTLAGRVPRERVPDYLEAMDVASLPQSVDGVGSFRYTTKLSEYLAAGLPVITGQVPLAYDLDDGWMWRLPGKAPWDSTYVSALAGLMATLGFDELTARRELVPRQVSLFDLERQQRQVCAFLGDLLAAR